MAALFALLAVPVSLFAASRISTDAADEEAGRLALVLATPTTRDRWFAANAAVAAAGGLLLAAGAGVATWVGATLVDAPLSLPAGLALNVHPGFPCSTWARRCSPSAGCLARCPSSAPSRVLEDSCSRPSQTRCSGQPQ